MPSPAAGTIAELLVPEGETVPVGTAIARIATGDAPAAAPSEPAPSEPAPAAAEPEPAPAEPASAAPAEPAPHFGPGTSDGGYASPPELPAGALAGAENGEAGDDSMRTFMSPVVARMVAEHKLDVAAIPGTGRGGRVTKKDVETYLAGGAGTAAPAAASETTAAPAPQAAPAAPAPAPAAAAPTAPPQASRPFPLRPRPPPRRRLRAGAGRGCW